MFRIEPSISYMVSVLRKTALYDLHIQRGARLVEFAGYEMPLQYHRGIREEHLHTRKHAGLFDVSHMGQIRLSGENVEAAMERLVTGDICSLEPFRQCYTLLTNQQGGIIDDLVLTRTPDGLLIVVNAACQESDFRYLRDALGPRYQVEMLRNRALLALQGPEAASVLSRLRPECETLSFFAAREIELDGVSCWVSRCGYTGEDGFEISIPSEQAGHLVELLLEDHAVELVGLGARDSLRLEAGLCLYGHDIDAMTTPVEADLCWVIAGKYHSGTVSARFPGANKIFKQMRTGSSQIRCGFRVQGRIPVREGAAILDTEKRPVGRITSGGFGPSVNHPVAMGYIDRACSGAGTALQVEIRRQFHAIKVVNLPFVKHRYYRR